MSYWRKLFIVMLLALSLPVQSFAAVSMKCVAAHAEASEDFAPHMGQVAPEHHHEMHRVALAGDDHHQHHHGNGHHAHSCSTCASCCFGTGLPAIPVVAATIDATRVTIPLPSSAGVVSFLTGGIERPPRTLLV
ncbi:hypothetical protein C6T60_15790 [Burkholderia multivorans]|nr:hypothetical protein C6T60_15790 [Burkholderia multivorans]